MILKELEFVTIKKQMLIQSINKKTKIQQLRVSAPSVHFVRTIKLLSYWCLRILLDTKDL
jgi:hypothetical protein